MRCFYVNCKKDALLKIRNHELDKEICEYIAELMDCTNVCFGQDLDKVNVLCFFELDYGDGYVSWDDIAEGKTEIGIAMQKQIIYCYYKTLEERKKDSTQFADHEESNITKSDEDSITHNSSIVNSETCTIFQKTKLSLNEITNSLYGIISIFNTSILALDGLQVEQINYITDIGDCLKLAQPLLTNCLEHVSNLEYNCLG